MRKIVIFLLQSFSLVHCFSLGTLWIKLQHTFIMSELVQSSELPLIRTVGALEVAKKKSVWLAVYFSDIFFGCMKINSVTSESLQKVDLGNWFGITPSLKKMT